MLKPMPGFGNRDDRENSNLRFLVTRIVENLLAENEHLSRDLVNKQELIEHIVNSILQKSKDHNEILDNIKKPEFLKPLVILFVMADAANDPKIKEDATKKLNKIFDPKSTQTLLEKRLEAAKALEPFFAKMVQQLQKTMKLEPKPGKTMTDLEEEVTKSLVNLFGSDPRFAGSVINVLALSHYEGNLYGAPDQSGINPDSNRPIDQANQISGKSDPLGIIQEAVENFVVIGGPISDTDIVDKAEADLRRHKLEFGQPG